MFFQPRLLFFDWLDSIGEFFSSLWDGIVAVFNFLIDFVTGIIDLLSMAAEATITLTESISSLPEILVAFATGTVTVVVIFLIVGRSHGGSE